MKKIFTLAAILMGAFAWGTAQAQDVNVQFYSFDQLPSGEAAGVDGSTDWNTLQANFGGYFPYGPYQGPPTYGGSPTPFNLGSASGTYSGVTFTISGDGYYDHNYGGGNIAGDPGSSTVLTDGIATYGGSGGSEGNDPVILTLTGLNPGEEYALVAYVGGQAYAPTEGSLSLTGQATQYFMSAKGGNYYPAQGTALIDGSSSTDFVAAAGGNGIGTSGPGYNLGDYQSNYLTFTGFTGPTATLTLTELGDFYGGGDTFAYAGSNGGDGTGNAVLGLDGVEIFDLGPAAPEPASVWLFSFGLFGLGFQIWRKRTARA